MRIAITGASGLIGRALVADLRTDGHDVVRLVRRAPRAGEPTSLSRGGEVAWDPRTRWIDAAGLIGTDAVVHLAGAGIGDRRWSAARKAEILGSRVNGTAALARALAKLDGAGPRVLLSGSAIGVYGEHGDAAVDEDCSPGDDFLARVCAQWEAAAAPARAAGLRVVYLRTGVVLSRHGGALARMLPLFRLGLGGRLGSGRQVMSWISLTDQVRAIRFALDDDRLTGPVNLTSPTPVTNAEFTRALAAALHRRARMAVPALALRLALGEMSMTVLTSQRVMPTRLTSAGFTFRHPTIDVALAAAINE